MLMPKLLSRHYDPMLRPWREKIGITLGMGMTEKQGGTDVRANTTRAEPDGDAYPHHRPQVVHVGADVRRLPGAGAGAGRAHLLLPAALCARTARVNALHFQRLKDKLGNRSNASSEVEFDDAYALRVGEEGARHPHHPADGAAHAARLRDLVGRHDAGGAGAGDASLPPSPACSASRWPISR